MKSIAENIKADICVIGAGSGGLSVAAGAAQMGAKTVLIEKAKMGGDCLNYGCVPSKALLAAAKHAYAMTNGEAFGIKAHQAEVDFAKVNDHVRRVIGAIEPNDSQERFESLGVTVIRAEARFTGPDAVEAGSAVIKARRFVIATGSSPAIPPIDGLSDVAYFTNETLFDNRELPEHLAIIGGGPIGVEMAQAHRRLGSKVSVLEVYRVLGRDDPDLSKIVIDRLSAEGIAFYEDISVASVEKSASGITVHFGDRGDPRRINASHLLVAAGRKANVDGLNLEAAGIDYDHRRIKVDARLRTSNRKVFAIGDVAGGPQFTHVAAYHAGIVIRNALFRLPARSKTDAVPWVTFTDPELANVGLTERDARAKYDSKVRILTWSLEENDRAQAERRTEGLVKVVTLKNGKILGAGIAAVNAGELIQPWVLAITNGLKIGAIASTIAPYPTLGEAGKRAAGSFYTEKLFGRRTKRLVRMLAKLG